MARLVRLISVSLGVAVAFWLLPASVHIVDWTAEGPVRIALLPPLFKLWVAVAAAFVVSGAIAASRLFKADAPYSPLALVWLCAIPYLPWIPDRAPALLILAGPLRWAVVALALLGCAAAIWNATERTLNAALPGRRVAFGAALALYLVFGLWSAEAVGPDADEPHYLVITQSLLRDHDLAIENNHARGDYREYFGSELHPDFLRRGLNEVIYSIHAPGLPALLVPAYAVAGYHGAVVMLCLLGALASLAVFDLATLLGGRAAGWMTWAAVCLTVPFVPHAWLIFPEMPGALLMAWASLWLFAPLPLRARTWLWRGAALALLPWLHTKFVILLATMVSALLLRIWRDPRAAAALVAPAVVSIVAWLLSFYVLYGVFDPQIAYGDFPRLYVLFSNIPRGLLGLLFDQKFGLLIYAPIYLTALAGCGLMVRRPGLRAPALALLATIIAFVASSTRMYMWWGGSSAPARFLVPILPLLAPMMAIAFQQMRSAVAGMLGALLLWVSVGVAAAGVMAPQRHMLFSAPHGFSNMAAAVQGGSPLPFLLPTFTEGETLAPLALLAPWCFAAVVALLVAIRMPVVRGSRSGFTAASVAVAIFVVGGAAAAGPPAPASQRRATASRGRLDLMRAIDGSSLRALDYARRVRLNEQQTLGLTAITVTRSSGELSVDPRHVAGPFQLPAGRFSVRLGLTGDRAVEGGASVTIGNGLQLGRSESPSSRAMTLTFDLPVDAPVSIAVSDEALARSVQQVDVVPEVLVPKRLRPSVEVRAIETIAGRSGAFIIYVDDETYPEGGVFWTRGTHSGTVLVNPAGASTLALTLHSGPIGGLVRVSVDGQDRSVTLTPDQTQQMAIPLTGGVRLVPVSVEAIEAFRPSEHAVGSSDHRSLGCQVRIELR